MRDYRVENGSFLISYSFLFFEELVQTFCFLSELAVLDTKVREPLGIRVGLLLDTAEKLSAQPGKEDAKR